MSNRFIVPTKADQARAREILAAKAELARREDDDARAAGYRSRADLSLLDFVPALSPQLERPGHLASFAERLERAEREPSIIAQSVTVQHGKSTLVWHWVAGALRRNPRLRVMYISYNQHRAFDCSRDIRKLAVAAGVQLDPIANSVRHWKTTDGGGLLAEGIGGATGYPADIIVVDDPHADRAEAESFAHRKAVHDFFDASLWTRRNSRTSVVVLHARWHPDDLIGHLVASDPEWAAAYQNIPAIDLEGQPLWPSRMPLQLLASARARNEYDWWSLYMGEPRGKGHRVFGDVVFAAERPKTYTVAIGIDLAYSAKSSSDYSTAVVLAREGTGKDAKFYVLDVLRQQTSAPAFAKNLKSLSLAHGGAHAYWYTSSTERGLADLMREQGGIMVVATVATLDKFQRAQPVASAWNAGRVFVPTSGEWLNDFTSEIAGFTGIKDRHDDQVDALASAFDALAMGPLLRPRGHRTALSNNSVPNTMERFQW